MTDAAPSVPGEMTEDDARARITELTARASDISRQIDARREVHRRGEIDDGEFFAWMRRAMSARDQARQDVRLLHRWLSSCCEGRSLAKRAAVPAGPPTYQEPTSLADALRMRSALKDERVLLDAIPTTPDIQRQRDANAAELARLRKWIKARNREIHEKYPSEDVVIRGLLAIIDRLMDEGAVLTDAEHSICDGAAELSDWIALHKHRGPSEATDGPGKVGTTDEAAP